MNEQKVVIQPHSLPCKTCAPNLSQHRSGGPQVTKVRDRSSDWAEWGQKAVQMVGRSERLHTSVSCSVALLLEQRREQKEMQYPPLFSISSPVEGFIPPLPAEGVCHAVSVPSCRGAHLKGEAQFCLSQAVGVQQRESGAPPAKSWTASELCLNVRSQRPRGPAKRW